MADADEAPDEDKRCYNCTAGAMPMGATICTNPDAHKEYMVWKCRFCCSESVWFCFGNTHFCDEHHRRPTIAKVNID
jgi:E3 ubiquitin-protein ligase MYCBP2